MKTVPERLKFARDLRGLSQAKLALLADVSTGTIGNIESEARKSKGSLPQIAEALNISHKWLASGTGEMELPAGNRSQQGDDAPAPKSIDFAGMLSINFETMVPHDEALRSALYSVMIDWITYAAAHGRLPTSAMPTPSASAGTASAPRRSEPETNKTPATLGSSPR